MGIHDRDYYQDNEMRPLRPWDNKSMVTLLIIANVAVHVANFLFTNRTDQLAQFLALTPQDLVQPIGWFRLLTYGFVHGSIFHLLFNMLTLYFLGRQVEDKYGKWEFLRIYVVSLVLCGIMWCVLRYGSQQLNVFLVGASGAVTTVAMLFVFSFPQATLLLYGVLPIKAWVLGIAIVLLNMFGTSAEVAYDVHLVGAGLAAAYFYGNFNFGILGSAFENSKAAFRRKRSGLKVHRPDAPSRSESVPSKDELEADRLLDKIHREGQDSLTARERSFLEKYSRKVREQRK